MAANQVVGNPFANPQGSGNPPPLGTPQNPQDPTKAAVPPAPTPKGGRGGEESKPTVPEDQRNA